MIPNWTNHLKDPEEKERFKKYIYGSRTILDRELVLVEEMEKELDLQETDPDQYSSPSWAALQADRNGYRRALKRVKKLITLDQGKNNG